MTAMANPPSRNDGVTMVCPICRHYFLPRGRQRVCSAACRQAVWRQRHPTVAATLAPVSSTASRVATVYECPSCDTRYLGTQRCPDCHQFCRRVGPGGQCPHCDEPVAVADLIADERR